MRCGRFEFFTNFDMFFTYSDKTFPPPPSNPNCPLPLPNNPQWVWISRNIPAPVWVIRLAGPCVVSLPPPPPTLDQGYLRALGALNCRVLKRTPPPPPPMSTFFELKLIFCSG